MHCTTKKKRGYLPLKRYTQVIGFLLPYHCHWYATMWVTCPCGTLKDARGLHGLSCRRSAGRHIRHSQLNDIIWRSLCRAKIPASKEPLGLRKSDGKRLDDVTRIPYSETGNDWHGMSLCQTQWQHHTWKPRLQLMAGAAADKVASNTRMKYSALQQTHLFVPVSVDPSNVWRQSRLCVHTKMRLYNALSSNVFLIIWCRNMCNAEIRRAQNRGLPHIKPAPHSWDMLMWLHLECRSCRSNTWREHRRTGTETSTGVVRTCSSTFGYRSSQCCTPSVYRRTSWTSGRR